MIDTFPYSSGLTAREAQAVGTHLIGHGAGTLLRERHKTSLASPVPARRPRAAINA